MSTIVTEFVRSAAARRDFPTDRLPQVAVAGRSNVGKSSLINALVRQKAARTSSTPGRTRLANFYRVRAPGTSPFYLVDLPGYGHASGGVAAAREFERITGEFFGDQAGDHRADHAGPAAHGRRSLEGVILVVDIRHPGLENDRAAHAWLAGLGPPVAVAATKLDKLSRAEGARAVREFETLFGGPVVATSVTTGEGMTELWKLLHNWIRNR